MQNSRPTNAENVELVNQLIINWEDETVEFKEANDNFKTSDIGKYVSALSNEANLASTSAAWLVFGVHNKAREVIGTSYRTDKKRLDLTKKQVFEGTSPNLALREIHVVDHPRGRVVMFEIPPAPRGVPISWHGHYYSRAGESLMPLSLDKLDQIRRQSSQLDWTAQVVDDADASDLLPEAIIAARVAFKESKSNRIDADTVDGWSDMQFLDHVGLTSKGRITRAALLLLGHPRSINLLSPHMAEITWRLMDQERVYEHFSIPFILTTRQVYERIRNYHLRLVAPGEMVQREVDKYDQDVILEAIHNCVAHQDYTRFARIAVLEYPDRVEFVSQGSFFEGSPDDYAVSGHMPEGYRNVALVRAMTHLNMIDHLGYGIEKMNRSQARRYLPLPEYDLSNPKEVRLTIYGSVVDEGYTRLLMSEKDIPFEEVLALDRIQKGLSVPDKMLRALRRKKLVEGRKPNLRVSASIAEATGKKADYVAQRGKSDEYCMALINEELVLRGPLTRAEIIEVLAPHMPTGYSVEQRKTKTDNLLRKMRTDGTIVPRTAGGRRVWAHT